MALSDRQKADIISKNKKILDRQFANGKVSQAEKDAINRKSAERLKRIQEYDRKLTEARMYRDKNGKIKFRSVAEGKKRMEKRNNKNNGNKPNNNNRGK